MRRRSPLSPPSADSPRSLFAVMTFISCGLMIGYFLSFDRAYLKDADRSNVFFWRSIIWIPIGEHLWISSWANLQASIISSQTAAGRQVVGPKVSNLTYLGGIAAGFCTMLVRHALKSVNSACQRRARSLTRPFETMSPFSRASLSPAPYSGKSRGKRRKPSSTRYSDLPPCDRTTRRPKLKPKSPVWSPP